MLIAAASFGVQSQIGVDDESLTLISLAVLGIGLGATLPIGSETILAATWEHKVGVGSAATDWAIQLGGAFGIAVMGSVLASSYGDELTVAGTALPPDATAAAQESIGAAVSVAAQTGPAGEQLLSSAREAFVAAQGDAMLVASGVALAGAAVALVALAPRWKAAGERARRRSSNNQT